MASEHEKITGRKSAFRARRAFINVPSLRPASRPPENGAPHVLFMRYVLINTNF